MEADFSNVMKADFSNLAHLFNIFCISYLRLPKWQLYILLKIKYKHFCCFTFTNIYTYLHQINIYVSAIIKYYFRPTSTYYQHMCDNRWMTNFCILRYKLCKYTWKTFYPLLC